MILIVNDVDLASLIREMPGGWQNFQIQYLGYYKVRHYYQMHLTKRQVNALGAVRIKNRYQAGYNPDKTIQEQVPSGTGTSREHPWVSTPTSSHSTRKFAWWKRIREWWAY